MKIFKPILAVACAAVLASCGANTYKVSGIVDDEIATEGSFVYLSDDQGNIQDSCFVENGKFSFTGKIDKNSFKVVELIYPGKETRFTDHVAAFIADSKDIVVCLNDSTYVTGSPLTDAYNDFESGLMNIYAEGDEAQFMSFCREAYLANADNFIGNMAFGQIAYELSLEEFDELYAKGGELIKSSEQYSKIREGLENQSKTGPGTMFLDFSGKTPDGEDVSLSDFVGKGQYVLVDFWASWCGPCMRSMPGLKAINDTYGPKGLQVLGVAVWDGDNSRSRVRIEEKGMTWPQIFVGEDKTPTDQYGILGIPHVIIFAPDGTVYSRQTPDEESLSAQVAELFQ